MISHGASFKPGDQVEYIGGLFKGSMSIIAVPTDKDLIAYSKAVYKNVPYSIAKTILADATAPGFPIPMKQNQSSPIKYVFMSLRKIEPMTKYYLIFLRVMGILVCCYLEKYYAKSTSYCGVICFT